MDHLAGGIQFHFRIPDVPEQGDAFLGAHGHKIRACAGIIVPL
jgi:hypothetical protein